MPRIRIPLEHKTHAAKLKSDRHIWEYTKGKRRLNARLLIAEQFAFLSEFGFNAAMFRRKLRKKDIASSELLKKLMKYCFKSKKIPHDKNVKDALSKIANTLRQKYYWDLAEKRLAAKSNEIIYKRLKIPENVEINAVAVVGAHLDLLERNGFDVDAFVGRLTKNISSFRQEGPYGKWIGKLIENCKPENITSEKEEKIKKSSDTIKYVFFYSLQVKRRKSGYYDSGETQRKTDFRRSIARE